MVPSWVSDPAPGPAAPPQNPPQDGQDGTPDDGQGSDTAPPAPAAPTPYPAIQPPAQGSNYGSARSDMTSGTKNGSSRALAGGIAGLASAISRDGPAEALRRFNLESLAGAPAQDVFVALTDALCPPGGTIDEAIARDALLETIADLAAKGIGNFDELTQDDLQEIFIGVVSRSIEGRILNEVGTNSIKLSPDIAAVDRAQKMLHSFVVGCVRDRFQDSGESVSSLDSGQIDGFVSDLYAASFDLMQTMGEAE